MQDISVGAIRYRIVAIEGDQQWIAHAVRTDGGARFGAECPGATSDEACARMVRWLEWQSAHADALEDLQRAVRAYHRLVAGSAFSSPVEGPSAVEGQRESLDALDAARSRLDEIRAGRPDPR